MIRERIAKHHAPEMMRLFAVAASSGETSHAADGVAQGESRRKSVAGSKSGHVMPAHVPPSGNKRGNQTTGKNASGLQRGNAENLARMRFVVAPLINYIKNLGPDDSAQDH